MALCRHTCVAGLLLLYITVCKSHPFPADLVEEVKDKDYMLVNDVEPLQYEIDLIVPTDFTTKKKFNGVVKIKLKLKEESKKAVDFITVHMSQITLDDSKSRVYEFGELDPNENMLSPIGKTSKLDMVTFKLDQTKLLEKAKTYILELHYTGILHEDMYGFYLSSYTEKGKTEKQYLATTQFQPTYARRAFPCFDEPNIKAEFKISITHPSEYKALSNTKGTPTIGSKSTKTQFEKTPIMSTYLIAFVVSKFKGIHFEDDGVENSVWAQADLAQTASYSLELAPKILRAMKEFTGVAYTESGLDKLDQVAIPDFSAGAMENWGLATYRENYLLWHTLESTAKNKQGVATVVAHELAHMWFGDLITCDWWSSTWLNEGFATYFEYHAVDRIDTENWRLREQFVIEQHQTVLNIDTLESTKALTSDVFTPSQISEKFNSITYNKGGSVIRMVEHIMGSKEFFEGLQQNYFKVDGGLRFANAKPLYLWRALQPKVRDGILPKNLDLNTVMKEWIENPGFPVVTVTSVDKETIQLQAKRFFFDAANKEASSWYIPISYTTSKTPNFEITSPTTWIEKEETIKIEFKPSKDDWIIFNIRETAYIRVNYDNQLWKRLENALQKEEHGGIHVLNRAQVIDDIMNLARAGQTPYRTAFDVIQYLEEEVDYIPWYPAFNTFAYLRQRFDIADEISTYLNTHISNLMRKLYKSVSFYNTPKQHVEALKRELTLEWACELGDEGCVNNSKNLFTQFKSNQELVDVELRSVVYCTALRHSENSEDWEMLRERLATTQLAPEVSRIISALGCTKNETLLNQYLMESISTESDIRSQDAQSVFLAVISGNQEGVPIGLTFLTENFNDIDQYYGGMNGIAKIITALADRLTKQEQCDELEKFVTNNNLKEATDAGINGVESCNKNIKWASTYRKDILGYLKEKIDGGTTEKTTTADGATITTNFAVLIISIATIVIRLDVV